ETEAGWLLGRLEGGARAAMSHRQQNFLHAGHPRRRRGMPDIAFDGAQAAVVFPGRLLFEYGRQRFQLDRIAQFGPGAMRFYVADGIWIDLMPGIDFSLQLDLAVDARRRYSVRPAVLIYTRP